MKVLLAFKNPANELLNSLVEAMLLKMLNLLQLDLKEKRQSVTHRTGWTAKKVKREVK